MHNAAWLQYYQITATACVRSVYKAGCKSSCSLMVSSQRISAVVYPSVTIIAHHNIVTKLHSVRVRHRNSVVTLFCQKFMLLKWNLLSVVITGLPPQPWAIAIHRLDNGHLENKISDFKRNTSQVVTVGQARAICKVMLRSQSRTSVSTIQTWNLAGWWWNSG